MYIFAIFFYNEHIIPLFISHVVFTIFASDPPEMSILILRIQLCCPFWLCMVCSILDILYILFSPTLRTILCYYC